MSATTVPFEDINQVKQASKYLGKYFNSAFKLVFDLMFATGLRVSDTLSLRYDDNIDFDKGILTIDEAKGTKQAQANARRKVLKKAREVMLAVNTDPGMVYSIMTTPVNELMTIMPENMIAKVQADIDKAIAKAKKKTRTCQLPPYILNQLKARQDKYQGNDDGNIFSKKTLTSNRAKNQTGVLTRQATYQVLSQVSARLKLTIKTSCHQLRKTFAVFLYYQSGKDSAKVVSAMGWTDDSILKTYLSIGAKDIEQDVKLVHRQMWSDFQ